MPVSPTWRRDRYDVNAANVNRHIKFRVTADTAVANTFLALKGPAHQYPHYHQIQGATDEQELGQIRTSLVVRAMSQYSVPVGIQVLNLDAAGAVVGDGSCLDVTYEVDEMGVFFNQEWAYNPAEAKHAPDANNPAGPIFGGTADWITDTVGTGGMPRGPKEKRGLNLLLEELTNVSWHATAADGPFGVLSTGGTITLPDGAVVTTGAAAPALPAGTYTSGLVVTWVGY